jgi:hypothetical protein
MRLDAKAKGQKNTEKEILKTYMIKLRTEIKDGDQSALEAIIVALEKDESISYVPTDWRKESTI